jgi:putative aldouronate transport system substrate-binding protein
MAETPERPSPSCEDVEAAARWLDFAYSEQGHMLMCFGVEGVSYTYVDSVPKYVDSIMHNPDGLSFAQAAAQACIGAMYGAYEQSYYQFLEAQSFVPQQMSASKIASLAPRRRTSTCRRSY